MIAIPKIALKPSSRGGSLRRVFAILIDLIMVTAIMALIGIGLATASGGKIRAGGTAFTTSQFCTDDSMPLELVLPNDFRASNISRCTKFFFGIPYDWVLDVAERTQINQITTYVRDFTVPLEPGGQLARPLYLNRLLLLAFAGYLFLLEWQFGASVGKRVLGLRVRALDGGPLRFDQAAKRTMMRVSPLFPTILYTLVLTVVDPMIPVKWSLESPIIPSRIIIGVSVFSMLIFVLWFVMIAWQQNLPLHDRWAGTEVVRR